MMIISLRQTQNLIKVGVIEIFVVMSLVISVKEAEFTFIREKTNSTAGNLSVQVQKLKEVG
jgi:hypothetical protein